MATLKEYICKSYEVFKVAKFDHRKIGNHKFFAERSGKAER